jgi:hypothetical protein
MLNFIELAPGWINLREKYGDEDSNDIYFNPHLDCLSFFPVFEKKNLKQAVDLFESSLMQGKKLNLSYLMKLKDLKAQAIDLCKQNITWREALNQSTFVNILSNILEIRKHDKSNYTAEKSIESIYNNSGINKERTFFKDINTYFRQNSKERPNSHLEFHSKTMKLNYRAENEKTKDEQFKFDLLAPTDNPFTNTDREVSFGNRSTESIKCTFTLIFLSRNS